nr:putative F-box protein At1g19160 [Ipomoea trifida]
MENCKLPRELLIEILVRLPGDFIIDGIEVVDMVFDVVIWNPSTREIKTLPSITVPNKPSNIPPINFCLYEGFGFGLSNNMTWKVVMLWYYGEVDVLSKDSYEIVLVCSRVGDSWTWRQIKAVPQLPVSSFQNFYLKGKCYWRVEVPQWLSSGPCRKEFLIWFDLDDEIFGTIELPSKWVATLSILVTVMNDTIALVSAPDIENENCIEIWHELSKKKYLVWTKRVFLSIFNKSNPTVLLRKGKSHCAVMEFQPESYDPDPEPLPNQVFYLIYKESESDDAECIYLDLPNSKTRGDLIRSDIANITSPEIIFDVLVLNPFTREVKVLPFIKVGDLWSWRQIDVALDSLYLGSLIFGSRDFYFKGKYYWQSGKGHLVWFDIDDEIFGKIERPSNVKGLDYFTVMNESIVAVTMRLPCTENEACHMEIRNASTSSPFSLEAHHPACAAQSVHTHPIKPGAPSSDHNTAMLFETLS